MRPAEVTVRAPGKVNLYLAVGALDDEGYHDVRTVLQAVSLYDELTATPADPGTVVLTIEGEGAKTLSVDEGNLAVRAARLLAASAGVTDGVQMLLRKAIPVAAGMAGGSADAAAALVACDALWGTDLGRAELESLAGRLGSDVPFSLVGGTALGTGRGDVLSPVLSRGTYHWVFAHRGRRALHPSRLRRARPLSRGASAPGALVALGHPGCRQPRAIPRRSPPRWPTTSRRLPSGCARR